MTPPPTADVVVAVNPTAGFGRGEGRGAAVVARLIAAGHPAVLVEAPTLAALEADLNRRLAEGIAALVVVGGDGMTHLAARLTAGTDVPFGIVPAGTGNDLARGLGIPLDDEAAQLDVLVAALGRPPRRIDGIRLRWQGGERVAAGVLSAGFDALVNDRANRMRRPRGASRYTIAMLAELLALRPRRYRLVVDGVERVVPALLVSVANNSSIGGGMRIVPDARLDDGLLDVFTVSALSRLKFLTIFPKVYRGAHTEHPAVRIEQATSVVVDAEGITGYADGEPVAPLPITVDVLPGALAVLASPTVADAASD